VATRRNNRGSAWLELGEHQKAIGYYEQALAGDLKTYGEDHPTVATRCSNLGMAWQGLGKHGEAIDYFERALKIFENRLDPRYPSTQVVRTNLATARAARAEAGAEGAEAGQADGQTTGGE